MTENENMPCTEEERRESGTTEAARVEAAGADNVHADNAAADHDADIPSEELDAKISSIGIDSGDEDDETVLDTIDTIEEKKDEALELLAQFESPESVELTGASFTAEQALALN